MAISLITRCDDFGSSRSANLAIAQAAITGSFAKNVSCMAVGPQMAEGAELLKNCPHICLGMHFTLNAEWDLIKWQPISPAREVPSLITPQGAFWADPRQFATHVPVLEQVMKELEAQFAYLISLGLDIRYVDSHMLPETFIPGFAQAFADWTKAKGVINHTYYYRFPAKLEPSRAGTLADALNAQAEWLDLLEDGQYFSVMHPAIASREMDLCCNQDVPVGMVRRCRDMEYRLLNCRELERMCEEKNIACLRYDQATALENPMTF